MMMNHQMRGLLAKYGGAATNLPQSTPSPMQRRPMLPSPGPMGTGTQSPMADAAQQMGSKMRDVTQQRQSPWLSMGRR